MDIKDFYKNLPILPANDRIVIQSWSGFNLAAPMSFWAFLEQDVSAIVNGCGPGGLGDFLIPDTIYGLSVKPACKIHDWMFTIYNDEAGFRLSNQVFLDNMIRINNSTSKNVWLKWIRMRRILKYYRAVRDFGRLFFYDAHIDLYQDQTVYA